MSANYSTTSMLDIIFEHRNKSYGAYVLRRDANKTVKTALTSILSVVTLLCFGNYVRENMHGKQPHTKDILVISNVSDIAAMQHQEIVKPKPPVPQPPKQTTPPAPVQTIKNVEFKAVANNHIADTITPTRLLDNVESGLHTNTTATATIGATDGTGTAAVYEVAKETQPKSDVMNVCEKMPEFPGGEGALLKFIARNTQYPDMEKDNGITGKVITQFTVNEDGSISDIKILRSNSDGFNREVTRVINKLPRFKPGMQQNKPVRVRYILPFTFNLN